MGKVNKPMRYSLMENWMWHEHDKTHLEYVYEQKMKDFSVDLIFFDRVAYPDITLYHFIVDQQWKIL